MLTGYKKDPPLIEAGLFFDWLVWKGYTKSTARTYLSKARKYDGRLSVARRLYAEFRRGRDYQIAKQLGAGS